MSEREYLARVILASVLALYGILVACFIINRIRR